MIADSEEYFYNLFAYKESKGLFYVFALNHKEYIIEFERKPTDLIYSVGILKDYDKICCKYALFEYFDSI